MTEDSVAAKLKATKLNPPASKQPAPAAAKVPPKSIFEEGFLKSVYEERPAGKNVFTRFPPEPNGFLHVGHCKAIATNFGFARYHGGKCYLRFDDTNPEAEEEKYFRAIIEVIAWLGFTPYEITYSSDHFDELYDFAVELIRRDAAYVCYCSDTEVKKQRGEGKGLPRYSCAERDRPIEESLAEFQAMRDGKYKPREAVLRMKQDMTSGNPQMWDLTAYRILEAEHHRTGPKWRIYPTYDFTHPICDSLENITQSMCTTEFMTARESYEWLCDKLGIYKPMQREYGRLNVTGTVLSKRKIMKLVSEGIVRDWDDPRLYTIVALRRRGVPPGALLSFVGEIGVSQALTNIQLPRFEQSVRKYLDPVVPRLMLVLDPVRVIIDDLPDDHVEDWSSEFGPPKGKDMGVHNLPFTKIIYIERNDFREIDEPDYRRLAPAKALPVGLLKTNNRLIKATTFKKNESTGLVTEIHASTYEYPEGTSKKKKAHSYIHWVAETAIEVEVREFSTLFKSENPDAAEGGFMADVNPDSEKVHPNAMIEAGLEDIRKRAPWPEEAGERGEPSKEGGEAVAKVETGPETVRFQGVRGGYYCLDKDTTDEKIIVNRIVSLKEDSGKI